MMSEKHKELALMGLTWLRNKVTLRGMRGTTEVGLDRGYVADAVAMCSLQGRFFKSYCEQSGRYTELRPYQNYFVCVFEAKATRSDFLSTFGKGNRQNRHKPAGSLHWCVTPRKLIESDELPDFWGLLEECGPGLREVKRPIINVLNKSEMDDMAHKLLWPLQAYRGFMICEKCGRWTRKALCNRCVLKANR